MPTAKVNGINIYYETHGEGEPLVMIHGTGFDVNAWALQTPDFSERFKVIVFDGRGCGRTSAPADPYTVQQMADDTAGLMDAIGVKTAHVLGFSMGGWIAIELALKYPERVKSLVLAGTSRRFSLLGAERTRVLIDLFDVVSPELFFRNFALWLFGEGFFSKKENIEGFVQGALNGPHPTTHHGLLGIARACLNYEGANSLEAINAPTLVVAGTDDIAQPPRQSRELASVIPNARLTVLDGCGHFMIYEAPESFNKAVLEFLGSVCAK